MKKVMLIGRTGSGKTSLTQRINNERYVYNKTQALDFSGDIIDTPGEYIENKRYYTALIITSCEAEVIAFVQDATEDQTWFPPAFAGTFEKEVIGIITKVDRDDKDIQRSTKFLQEAGAEKIFEISSETEYGIEDLVKYLK